MFVRMARFELATPRLQSESSTVELHPDKVRQGRLMNTESLEKHLNSSASTIPSLSLVRAIPQLSIYYHITDFLSRVKHQLPYDQ